MTFTYGADDPYCLIFEPVDKSIQPIRVKWEKTVEEIITDAPAPDYPKPMTWEELRSVPKPGSDEASDLFDWLQTAMTKLESYIKRDIGTIIQDWNVDRKGYHYTFAYCDRIDDKVFIHENNFINPGEYSLYDEDDVVSFRLKEDYGGRYSGLMISNSKYKDKDSFTINRIHNLLSFPLSQIWRDGRSIEDFLCPTEFKDAMNNILVYIDSLLQKNDIPRSIKEELLFLFSSLHKDMPDKCIQWISDQVEGKSNYNNRAIADALGDVSKPWQINCLRKLKNNPDTNALHVFAYAIWREKHFIDHFSLSDCNAILNNLVANLANTKPNSIIQDDGSEIFAIRKWGLELLLGMLRTRNSSNEEIKMLLQPHQKITKELAKQVERLEDIVAKSRISLSSRIQLGDLPPKPKDDKTPDLLYALRLYLTGDTGANAIRITGVSDSDDE